VITALRSIALLFALALSAIGLVFLFYAMVLSNGEHQIPEGAGQMIPWFLLPSIGTAGAVWAVCEASRAFAKGRSLRVYRLAVGLAVAGYVASYGYGWLLTS